MAHDHGLLVRSATMADAPLLYRLRNDPETRSASRQTAAVSWAEHLAWLSGSLVSSERIIRIAEQAGKPVGVVRADRLASTWELSWTVAPEVRGRGIGRAMVGLFVKNLTGPVVAVVRRDNAASVKIAAAAGLRRTGPADERGFDLWVK